MGPSAAGLVQEPWHQRRCVFGLCLWDTSRTADDDRDGHIHLIMSVANHNGRIRPPGRLRVRPRIPKHQSHDLRQLMQCKITSNRISSERSMWAAGIVILRIGIPHMTINSSRSISVHIQDAAARSAVCGNGSPSGLAAGR